MAKKADTKKSKAPKLPKQIGGVKLSKDLRKKGGALLAKANTPLGREMIASGLAAVAIAAASRSKAGRAAAGATSKAAGNAAEAGAQDMRQMADAIGSLAETAMKRFFEKRSG